ncbi:two-partner secretion domain-containing protein [Coleofasciculus chthonoplastes]|uniref:two-partner secretion domain-containing protein n=1 Tax=Coleofasciculus chthonoplastes TaxID=64178 RepID=UPI0032F4B4FC
MKPIIRYLCRVSSIALSVLAAISPAKSQIEADNTLPVNSQVTGCPSCLIKEGTVRGGNLFHSFEEFSVPTGGVAFFDNASSIENILGRVTGSTLSNIDGLIRANGTVNLFLINPNGIIFGENAQLNIGGSFVASTANAIGFGNQGVFSATEPEAPPLLTVNPDALFFNQLAAQGVSSIEVRGSLSVPSGESLLLVGGNIAPDATSTGELLIDGGTLEAFGGRVELAGVGAPGELGLVVDKGSLGLDFPADLARTDIAIFDSIINVTATGGGDIVIYPRDLFISNSQLLAGIFSGLGAVDAQAGDITIDATGTVVVAEGVISNNVEAGATGRGGDVRITASSLSVTNGAQIDATTLGEGDAGKIVIRATDSVLLDGEDSQGFSSGVFSQVAPGAKGNSGGVEIFSGSLTVTNGARIDATTFGEGDAGKIVIRATDSILLNGEDSQGFPSGVFSTVQLGAKGNSGGVEIDSGSLSAINGAVIDATTFEEGDAGKIVILATDSILLDGKDSQGFPSGVFSAVASGANGNSGGVEIDSGSLSAINGAVIDATTFAEGDAGKIVIRATDSILLDGKDSQGFPSGVFSTVASGAKGNSGGVNIESGSLTVTNGAQINATSFGEGDAGKIVILATDSILLDGEDSQGFPSGVFSQVEQEAKGNSEGVEIFSGSLSATNGAQIDATTFAEGDAGKIVILATDSIFLDGEDSQGLAGGVFSTVQPGAKGNSEGVEIYSGSLSVTNGALISANTGGEGDAGKVVIRATDSIFLDGEDSQGLAGGVTSQVIPGAEGNSDGVEIFSASLSVTNGALISATTFGEGDAGKIVILATDSILLDGKNSQGLPSGVFSTVQLGAKGNSGGVNIESGSLSTTNGALISASTGGEGDAGKVVIRATDSIFLDGEDSQGFPSGVTSQVEQEAKGNSEGVEIFSSFLSVTNGAVIDATTLGEGDAGKVVIRVTDSILLDGEDSQGFPSGVFSGVTPGAKGNSGGVNIESASLSVTNGARISATTLGEGDAGKIVILATDSILLNGEDSQGNISGVFSTVQPEAKGNSRGVDIESGSLALTNGARIDATTLGEGNAGKIVIRATDSILLDGEDSQGFPSGVFSTVQPEAKGNSRGVEILSGSLTVTNDALISAETRSDTRAGDVSIDAKDFIQLSGDSGIRASATTGGPAGNLDIITQRLSVEDGAQITVSSPSGQAGNLTIGANSLELNQGQVTAETGTSGIEGGANIRLQNLNTLLMTDESLISATAFEDANGGNININSIFLIALPPEGVNGSDIIANAERGDGGRIIINGEGIFGIEERRAIPGNRTNDIDASSQFGGAPGEIQLNVPLDPARGLVELPGELVDVTRLVEQNLCQAAQGSSFIVTGRGGLPTPPHEPLNPEATWEDWRIESESESTANPTQDVETRHGASGEGKVHQQTPDNQPKRIIEAQGWYRDAKGTVILTAEPTRVTPHGNWLSSINCSE